ncbi:zinc finger (CCCH-type) family protein [Actinidia rufa]|uniref:Zinc finger (CCCH-type) family protein n=1 Tax=Actinidia rufa TaxID=165716 RepID=A0A7J0DBH7_9ERIC|nr:zinc finger (CCCH-type) family protein [Actinidia rufa]
MELKVSSPKAEGLSPSDCASDSEESDDDDDGRNHKHRRREIRGRGRESGSWSQHDPRLSIVDIASQMVPQGSGTPSLFAGGGCQMSQTHKAHHGVFHRCRDFEERGFCLRGDMCQIVVEDVQSLSQFYLPVSLPSAHLLGTPSALPSVTAPSSTLINSKNSKSFGNECPMTSTATTVESQITSSSIWGRISTKGNEMKDKIDCNISSSNYNENEAKGDQEPFANLQEAACPGKQIIDEDIASQADSSLKKQGDTGRTQKTFSEVIDIYIPLNSERAFVQFSKREEAEAALKALDAIMGNRFIKLWWANRDNIPVDGMGSGNSVSVTPRGVPAVPASTGTKPVVINSPRAPPLQKKQESLELLKEELREKQELLDKKRNDFCRQLDKLGKQSELAAKRHKPGTVADVAKAATTRSADTGTVVASPVAEAMAEKDKYMENVVHQNPKQNTYLTPLEPSSLKHSIRPLAPAGVAVLKEHFSAYGELSAIELEDVESSDSVVSKNFTAHISFAMRHSAEKAFAKGNCLQGYNLQFMWLAPTNSSNDNSVREKPSSASNIRSDANVQPAQEVAPVDPHKESALGNGEAEILERKESGGECIERNED